jgi:hypothetical protein
MNVLTPLAQTPALQDQGANPSCALTLILQPFMDMPLRSIQD